MPCPKRCPNGSKCDKASGTCKKRQPKALSQKIVEEVQKEVSKEIPEDEENVLEETSEKLRDLSDPSKRQRAITWLKSHASDNAVARAIIKYKYIVNLMLALAAVGYVVHDYRSAGWMTKKLAEIHAAYSASGIPNTKSTSMVTNTPQQLETVSETLTQVADVLRQSNTAQDKSRVLAEATKIVKQETAAVRTGYLPIVGNAALPILHQKLKNTVNKMPSAAKYTAGRKMGKEFVSMGATAALGAVPYAKQYALGEAAYIANTALPILHQKLKNTANKIPSAAKYTAGRKMGKEFVSMGATAALGAVPYAKQYALDEAAYIANTASRSGAAILDGFQKGQNFLLRNRSSLNSSRISPAPTYKNVFLQSRAKEEPKVNNLLTMIQEQMQSIKSATGSGWSGLKGKASDLYSAVSKFKNAFVETWQTASSIADASEAISKVKVAIPPETFKDKNLAKQFSAFKKYVDTPQAKLKSKLIRAGNLFRYIRDSITQCKARDQHGYCRRSYPPRTQTTSQCNPNVHEGIVVIDFIRSKLPKYNPKELEALRRSLYSCARESP